MSGDADPHLTNSFKIVQLSHGLVRDALRRELGWPHPTGKQIAPALYGLSADSQREARLVLKDTYDDWVKAGRPRMNADRCKSTYMELQACIRSGHAAPYPGSAIPENSNQEKA